MDKKKTAGRVVFVGAGPGDPGLLAWRARETLIAASVVFADPAVPREILSLIGTRGSADENGQALSKPDPLVTVLPEEIDSSDVVKMLLNEAKNGNDVVRLVAGDPGSSEEVVAELLAIARSQAPMDVIPGVSATAAAPLYAGIPLGSIHTEADLRGDVDWSALASAPGSLVLSLTAKQLGPTGAALIDQGLPPSTPVAITSAGTTRTQKTLESTLSGLSQMGVELPAPLVLTVGRVVGQRSKLNWWESRALFSWSVLVPRTKDQAGEMCERLVSHGAIPVEVPTIAVEPARSPAQMERAVKGLVDGRYQWVVFTSTNAVRAVWEKFNEFGLDARAFSGVKIACVGPATAKRVREFGIEPELVPEGEQSSLGLLDEFPPYDEIFDPVNRVLLPRADIATETLTAGLRDGGWEVDDVTAYRTVRAAPPPAEIREMIKTGGFDAVCFTSSSTVRNLVGIAGKPHARTIIACIGPKTVETAQEFGLRVDVQPEVASAPALVDALAEHAARLRAEGALPPPRKRSRRSSSR
jgi:uroporphyrinogen III methyltransferase/synthase